MGGGGVGTNLLADGSSCGDEITGSIVEVGEVKAFEVKADDKDEDGRDPLMVKTVVVALDG